MKPNVNVIKLFGLIYAAIVVTLVKIVGNILIGACGRLKEFHYSDTLYQCYLV